MINIYIDVLFFLNFSIDFLSLFSVKKILALNVSKVRCCVAALLGAAWSTVHFILGFSPIAHIAAAAVIVSLVTKIKPIEKFLGGIAVFTGAELFIGGCVTAFKGFTGHFQKQSLLLTGFILLFAYIGCEVYTLAEYIIKRRLKELSLEAKIFHCNKHCNALLLVDSGNLVTEHESHRRVIFVKASSIKKITGDIDTLFEREKCYVIPIDTPSGRGTVMGFVPEKIVFSDKKYNKENFIIVPDLNGGKFGGYDGIAPLV